MYTIAALIAAVLSIWGLVDSIRQTNRDDATRRRVDRVIAKSDVRN